MKSNEKTHKHTVVKQTDRQTDRQTSVSFALVMPMVCRKFDW